MILFSALHGILNINTKKNKNNQKVYPGQKLKLIKMFIKEIRFQAGFEN